VRIIPPNPRPQNKSKTNKMKKELFNQLLNSETTEELVDLLPYEIKRDHLLTADKISSVFRSESKMSITLDDKTILTWDCEDDRERVEYVWVYPITKDNVYRESALVPKITENIFEETVVENTCELVTELDCGRLHTTSYTVVQSWGTLILSLEQLQNLFYIKGN